MSLVVRRRLALIGFGRGGLNSRAGRIMSQHRDGYDSSESGAITLVRNRWFIVISPSGSRAPRLQFRRALKDKPFQELAIKWHSYDQACSVLKSILGDKA
jgi:hypothetical protein